MIFKNKYKLKVRGDGSLTDHLGADYFHDQDGNMVSQPKKYAENVKELYCELNVQSPRNRDNT